MDTLLVVTGGSAGLGRAVLATAPDGGLRLDVSRSGADLGGVRHVSADLADPGSWSEVGAAIAEVVRERPWERITVVHAAGTLDPIGFAGEVDDAAYTANVLLNSAATQVLGHHALRALTGVEAERRDLVMISSGAARSSYPGWSSYGAAKAAADRWVATVGEEQQQRGGVRVLSVAPGVVATGMQALIRDTDERDFPGVDRFRRLHADGQLVAPEDAATALWRLLDDDTVGTGAVVDLRER